MAAVPAPRGRAKALGGRLRQRAPRRTSPPSRRPGGSFGHPPGRALYRDLRRRGRRASAVRGRPRGGGRRLVGADGAHSVVRTALLGPSPIRYRGYTTAGALTPAGSVPVPRDGSETWGRGIRFGVAPTSGERVVWYAVWKAPAGEAGVSPEHLLRLFGRWHEPVRAVIEATPPDTMVRKDVYDRLPGRRWTRGHVALIGDAIHLMTPDLGQGACQAMVDAVTLADCLAQGGSLDAALVSYQRQRWRNAAFTTVLARTFGNMGQLDRHLTCGARDALVRAMPLSVQLRQLDLVVGRPSTSQPAKRRAG